MLYRAIHRDEWKTAEALIAEAREATDALVSDVSDYPNLYYAGYTQDAIKEFVEANLTYAWCASILCPVLKIWGLISQSGVFAVNIFNTRSRKP